jgi:phospholipid transport system substrate-binding protein
MKKNIIYHLMIAFTGLLLLAACPALAQDAASVAPANDVSAVEQLLKTKTEAVLEILRNKTLDEAVKKDQIMGLIEPIIDFPLMSKLTLGKANWGKLSAAQQTEFVGLFVDRLKRSYLDKTTVYNGEKVAYRPGVQKGNKVNVPVDIITNDKPIELLYKFYSSDTGWKAYDLEINGVSLIKSYQAQFTEMLKTGSPEDLLTELKKPVTETAAPAARTAN